MRSPEGSTKQDSSTLTKDELEENIVKNSTKLKNPKEHRKAKLLRQATIKEEDKDKDLSKKAIRMKNVTKLKINTNIKEEGEMFSAEIMSPTEYLGKGEVVSKL